MLSGNPMSPIEKEKFNGNCSELKNKNKVEQKTARPKSYK